MAVTELDEPLDVPVPVTVTVYVPAVVPALPPPPPPPPLPTPPPPPQPIAPIEINSTASPTIASQLRRRGTPISITSASAVPPADGQNSFFVWFPAVVAAVVVTVKVEVCAVLPFSVTEAGLKLHVAGSLAAVGLMEQLKFTVPEYPFIPATPMVAVLPVVAPGATEIVPSLPLDPLGPKVGSAVTVSETVVVALSEPEVPVTVTVTGPPNVAVLLADSVNIWVPAAVAAAKLAFTPVGNPVAASATVPVNPPRSATEIVLVPLPFCAIDTLVGKADNEKFGDTVTVTESVPVALL